LLVASIPLAIGVAGWLRSRGVVLRKSPLPFLLIAGFVPLAALGTIASGSVAGLILLVFVIVASAPILLSNLSRRWRWGLIGGTLLLVAGAIGVGLFSPNLGDFGHTDIVSNSETGRPYMWRTTWSAIRAYFPYGSGFGSFESVFRLFEDPDLVKSTFANHAHNDLLEFVLESGLPGVLLLLLFLGWFVQRLWVIWFAEGGRRMALAKGASVALAAILLHSLVDYPVRTAAMAVVFGLCCALMARTEDAAPTVASESKSSSARHLSA
jgi:O-antigen ligase